MRGGEGRGGEGVSGRGVRGGGGQVVGRDVRGRGDGGGGGCREAVSQNPIYNNIGPSDIFSFRTTSDSQALAIATRNNKLKQNTIFFPNPANLRFSSPKVRAYSGGGAPSPWISES